MPYRTSSWTLLRVREGGPQGRWAFVVVAVVFAVVLVGFCTLLLGRTVLGPDHLKSVAALVCLVPFTALWIAVVLSIRRARIAFYVEGFVSGRRRSEAVSWNDVAAVRRAKQDPDITHAPGWIIETRSGDEVYLEVWLVQPEVDLAPLRDRGFELPTS